MVFHRLLFAQHFIRWTVSFLIDQINRLRRRVILNGATAVERTDVLNFAGGIIFCLQAKRFCFEPQIDVFADQDYTLALFFSLQ